MRKIEHKGNMPDVIGAFAFKLGGIYSNVKETEFWEASSISEFEKSASEIGYEIIPAIDGSTKRAFLVGFDAEDSVIVSTDGQQYSQLKMYFIEVSTEEFNTWDKKIKSHREDQLNDMSRRREINEAARKKTAKKIGVKND